LTKIGFKEELRRRNPSDDLAAVRAILCVAIVPSASSRPFISQPCRLGDPKDGRNTTNPPSGPKIFHLSDDNASD
jgi:hypothetical protein